MIQTRDGLHRWCAGMAPCAYILNLESKTNRKVSIGMGGTQAILYRSFPIYRKGVSNFQFNIALSEPKPEDNWTGYVGFIHQVVRDNYLSLIPHPGY